MRWLHICFKEQMMRKKATYFIQEVIQFLIPRQLKIAIILSFLFRNLLIIIILVSVNGILLTGVKSFFFKINYSFLVRYSL